MAGERPGKLAGQPLSEAEGDCSREKFEMRSEWRIEEKYGTIRTPTPAATTVHSARIFNTDEQRERLMSASQNAALGQGQST